MQTETARPTVSTSVTGLWSATETSQGDLVPNSTQFVSPPVAVLCAARFKQVSLGRRAHALLPPAHSRTREGARGRRVKTRCDSSLGLAIEAHARCFPCARGT
jgi:hypothetical protein